MTIDAVPGRWNPDGEEATQTVDYQFRQSRREFIQALGAGLVISVAVPLSAAQPSGRRRGGRRDTVAARIHLAEDGAITVLTGKVEMGQGARTELAQAAAEELHVSVDQVQMVMGDTGQVPDDGITAGSRTTPSTVPAVRQAAATARLLLIRLAGERWEVAPETLRVRDGVVSNPADGRTIGYGQLAESADVAATFRQTVDANIQLTPVSRWRVLGTSVPRPKRRDLVTGAHRFPSDITRPGMLYGRVLRAPSYGATLQSIDLQPARVMDGVVVVRDETFVGVAAPTSFQAQQALDAIAATAQWKTVEFPSSEEIFDYLRDRVPGGVPSNPFAAQLDTADRALSATYHVAYVQHAPLEPRVALAEWDGDRVTIWTGTQNPFGYQREVAGALRIPSDRVRIVVPDFGSGFGGKHTGECAVEAVRLARAAQRPVMLRWTREEEFTWAYFRPAAVIDVQASLDESGQLTSWHFVNINSGAAAVNSPYRIPAVRCQFVRSDSPLRQGSYRTLAATANVFARESFMDELAAAAGADPLDFRLAHLDEPRLRAVLTEVADRFRWRERVADKRPDIGVGLACGTEKGSVVAACAEVVIEPGEGQIRVRHVCQVFECGAVINPDNLRAQIQGCIVMGLGPALREEMRMAGGRLQNADFASYQPPRFSDMPELDIHLLNRPDLPSVGGGETPIIAIAPAIANAVFHATGQRIRSMPLRLAAQGEAPPS
jgi:isoquinoline 1-oxidoreductase